jgi:hypothetical protein
LQGPAWAPIVLSGAVPKGPTDLLAILIIGMVSLESAFTQRGLVSVPFGLWFILLAVPLVCALASLSDTARKLREELALFAYGGSSWQVWLRYFLRGLTCSLIAIVPFLYGEYSTAAYSFSLTILSALGISIVGGLAYAAPSLTRIRSATFAENYKG